MFATFGIVLGLHLDTVHYPSSSAVSSLITADVFMHKIVTGNLHVLLILFVCFSLI